MSQLRRHLKEWDPGVILNSRMQGYGDYQTPEQALPVIAPNGTWELCMTINDSWGYQKKDRNFKTVRQIVRLLTECASPGGNLLLDVGPRSDGTITPEEEKSCWASDAGLISMRKRSTGTSAGIPKDYYYGPSLLSKDRTVLYLICYDHPADGVYVKGIHNDIKRVSVVGGGEMKQRRFMRATWANQPGILIIDLPEEAVDPDATVIKN